ncbi:hypothetical protein BgAZ_104840 [Babesia gibsoni]|uniref:Uncharacterized protein n=1 Tax=Babesia gibsoni TaxID=33632 RepID=A0AAD8PFN6_BABGI|nr:hypothetical protein BgAZ_104840 [Babesia gibsoni]
MDWSLVRCAIALLHIWLFLNIGHAVGQNPGSRLLLCHFKDQTYNRTLIPAVVDVSRVDLNKGYNVSLSQLGEGIQAIGVPSDGYKITQLVYGKNQIFAVNEAKCEVIEKFTVYSANDDIIVIVRVNGRDIKFGLVGEGFVLLTPKEYDYRITQMGEPYTLDLSNRESTDEVDVIDAPLNDIITHNYIVQQGFKTVKVVDNTTVLWDGEENEHIRDVKLTELSKARLVSLIIENPNESKMNYYIGDDCGYHTLSSEEFYKCFVSDNDTIDSLLNRKKDSTLRGTT